MSFLMEIAFFVIWIAIAFIAWILALFIAKGMNLLWVRARILEAYRVKRLRQEIDKRKIDFEKMIIEHHELCEFVLGKKQSTKGTLDIIDNEVTGETEDEPKKGKKAN